MENKKSDTLTESQTRSSRTPVAQVKTRRSNGTTLAIVMLSILLGLSVIFGVTAAFFSANRTANGTITLGNPVDINITQGGATVTTLTFTGNAMPGTVYSQPIAVSLPAGTSDAVIRGKLTITNSDTASVNVTAETASGWTSGEDGYYYYNGKMSAGESQDFVTSITVPKTLTNTDANKTYALSVQIEAIQFANGAAAEVWTTAPSSWVTSYGSGTIA
jgi:predicted ribosomally synthesized peptide with SipW-like signal peptide